jgi:hypothetical protein
MNILSVWEIEKEKCRPEGVCLHELAHTYRIVSHVLTGLATLGSSVTWQPQHCSSHIAVILQNCFPTVTQRETAAQVCAMYRESFCITITHRATHRLLFHHSTTVLSGSRCSLLSKWAPRGHVFQPRRTSDGMRRPNCGRFQQKPSVGAYNSGRIHGTSVYARKGLTVKVIG